MKINILTLFPEMFVGPFSESIIKRAQEKGSAEIQLINIRDFGQGPHRIVDDKPYGGGIGMVMKVNVIDKAIQSVKQPQLSSSTQRVILLDPRGKQFKQAIAQEYSKLKHLILLCAHYEGIDERVRNLVDETLSIGDFVVTGGEIPAMLVTDAVVRLVEGVLKDDATSNESFSIPVSKKSSTTNHKPITNDPMLLEYPQYTTPQEYNGIRVPDVLLSGNHKEIEKWRHGEAIKITKSNRPDLLKINEN